ncbi:MAG: Glu/Leu/Phe/Val dehydrogenase dimerization domain-containing protein [Gemmatimonadota bacterium]
MTSPTRSRPPDPRDSGRHEGQRRKSAPGKAGSGDVWDRYARFLARPPETVLEWNDPASDARGWLVLNSLRGGAAGGGTRMRQGLDRDEVIYLSKVMELKFAVSGPPIGGAKAGLDFDPSDPRKREVLRRWFRAIEPFLRTRYGTAGDLNVDVTREVVPVCEELGLDHPQAGIAVGHFGLRGEALERRLDLVSSALDAAPAGELGLEVGGRRMSVADLVTGFGVAVSVTRLLETQGRDPRQARVLVEGFGNVGGAAALFLARAGARIVGIVDVAGGLVDEDGLDAEALCELLRGRTGGRLPIEGDEERSREHRSRFRSIPADVMVCAASSGTVDARVLDRLEAQGVDVLACGANRPFRADHPGDIELERAADERFSIIADVVANCGAARAFHHQMRTSRPARAEEIFASVRETIADTVDRVVERAGGSDRGLLAAAMELTLERIGASSTGGAERG